ncbi:uncharacterized protein LOC116267138 [Nymphaea colorata]|nr:uncharacterized protein LOC116267138 [Nymphaea colorata]
MAKLQGFANAFVLFLASVAAIQCVSGEIVCEKLPTDICAFAISSSGMRCVLEKYVQRGEVNYQCVTSQVRADKLHEAGGWIETDECVQACGVDRSWAGISSDPLLDLHFMDKLCSPPCYKGCPKIVDLYFNLALAEGVFLPNLCDALKSNPRRAMAEATFKSGSIGDGAPAPASAAPVASAPAPF